MREISPFLALAAFLFLSSVQLYKLDVNVHKITENIKTGSAKGPQKSHSDQMGWDGPIGLKETCSKFSLPDS